MLKLRKSRFANVDTWKDTNSFIFFKIFKYPTTWLELLPFYKLGRRPVSLGKRF